MAIVYKYNSQYSGKYYAGSKYYTMTDGSLSFNVFAALDGRAAIVTQQLTGYYFQQSGKTYYQTTTNVFIDLADGWEYTGYSPLAAYSTRDAQYFVDKVIKGNQHVLKNNLVCARFANRLTEDEQLMLYQLQSRMSKRNDQLASDGLCVQQKISSPPGYNDLSNHLQSFMNAYASGESIGLVISTSTIIIAAVVIGSLATAAYFAYKYLASEAEKDVKFSDDLTRTLLSRLTPEEYEQLMRETQGIVTKSKILSSIGGGLGLLKWGLLAVAGFVVYRTIKKKGE